MYYSVHSFLALLLFFSCYGDHRDLHSFPTRRSSDLHGFTLFPETGFESVTLTCVNNGAKPSGRVADDAGQRDRRSEEHTSELQSLTNLVCRLLLEKKK